MGNSSIKGQRHNDSDERVSLGNQNSEKAKLEEMELLENGNVGPQNGDVQMENTPQRETWGKKVEFILACIGYAVGLGNVWRFPYLTFKNGGGAFLIPYFTMLFLCGMPLFFMELAIGQYFSLGPVTSWSALCPIAKGVGFAQMMVSFLCTIYYNVIIAWVLYYMYESLKSEVPWKTCSNWWNTDKCIQDYKKLKSQTKICGNSSISANSTLFSNFTTPSTLNHSISTQLSTISTMTIVNQTNITKAVNITCETSDLKNLNSPSKEFWERYVLQITSDISETGEMRYDLLVCLLLAWILVYLCLCKGIKTSGKVVYFTATFPYLLMFILLIRGATLPGARKGIEFYLKPDFKKLGDAKVWVAAATQIFYSLGIGFGSLIAFGSYNKFHNNIVRDAVAVSLINCCTSVFAGAAIFCVMGYMAEMLGKDVKDVATSGPGLAFVVYAEGVAQMPISPLWAILFFFMILTIGLDTQFAMLEAVITGMVDEYPKYFKRHKSIFIGVVCFICFLLGIPLVTQGGMYLVNLFDWQSGGVSLVFVAFFEVITVSYGYGADNIEKDIELMLGSKPSRWWRLCWKFFSPAVMLTIFIFSLVQWSGVSYGASYKYPQWAEVIGWGLALCSMTWIPGIALYKMLKTPGSSSDKCAVLFQPDPLAQQRVVAMNNLGKPLNKVKL